MKIIRFLMVLLASLTVLAACGGNASESAAVSDLPPQTTEYEIPDLPAVEDTPAQYEQEPDDVALEEEEVDDPASYEPEDNEPARLTAAPFPFEFEARDLYGNIVTHESLGERELFLLYFWTTWCRVCVIAMPGMAELAAEFYERMGFVSLLGDFGAGREAAIRMTEDVNAPFFSVDIMLEDFVPLIPFVDSGFVPTSALIDAHGNKIGDMIMGSDIDELRVRINAALGN